MRDVAGTSVDTEVERLRAEVWDGLEHRPRRLSSKWFYDTRGSELFEVITRLPEYYPTRTEIGLLERHAAEWMRRIGPNAMVELGAGSARKTRILLDAMERVSPGGLYIPLDVSADFLEDTARKVRAEYPELTVSPEVADLTHPLDLPDDIARPLLMVLLGGTIGNFPPAAASRLLRHVREELRPGDAFLLGADLAPGPGKSVEMLEAAYNDARGVTADFNLNVLRVLNREAGTDFAEGGFFHRAFWNREASRIEMHLVADGEQEVSVPGHGTVRLVDGESVRTEISCKYDRPSIDELFAGAGLVVAEWVSDDEGRYAMILGEGA